MVLALALSWSVAVSANFVPSVTVKPAPEVSGSTDANGNNVQIIVVSYGDVNSLPEEAREAMHKAYEQIMQAKDISKISKDVKNEIKTLAKEAGVKTKDLVVSDFFDLSPADLGEANGEGTYNVSLAVSEASLKNFVCLLHFVDGKWEVVSNAQVSADGKTLSFSVDGFSPFAIVTGAPEVAPVRNPVPVIVWVLIGVLIGALIDTVVIFILEKKAKKAA